MSLGNGGRPGWDGHLLLLHHSERERRAGLIAWTRRGLELGQKVIYTERQVGPVEASLVTLLADAGVDAAAALRAGQIEVVPPAALCPYGDQPPMIARALSEGYRGVRVSIATTRAVMPQPQRAAVDLERIMDGICRGGQVSVLCLYEPAHPTAARLDEVVAEHAAGVRGRQLSSYPVDDGLALSGEIDVFNGHLLRSVLRVALDRASTALRLDLRTVRLIDAATVRTIVRETDAYRRSGGQLVLRARGTPEHVLRILGVDRLANVTLLRGGP